MESISILSFSPFIEFSDLDEESLPGRCQKNVKISLSMGLDNDIFPEPYV